MNEDDAEDGSRAALQARLTADLRTATRLYGETADAHDRAKTAAAEAVLAALKSGVPPTTVAELSPFTATYVRQIARADGIPAATTRRSPQRRRVG